MDDIKRAKEQLLNGLKKSRDQAIDSIRKFRQDMEYTIEKLEKESIKKVEEEYAACVEELQREITEAQKQADDLIQIANELKKSTGNKAQEFVCVKGAQKNTSKFEEARNHLQRERTTDLVFVADTKIQNFLQQFKTFGQVNTTCITKSTVYVVKGKKSVYVKLTEDTSGCAIMGSCFTSNGDLLLTDNSNKKLKRVAISTASVKDYVDLEAGPYAVCRVSKNEAAVSLVNKTIQFVSLGDKMATKRQLKLDHTCYGLAYTDGRLLISDLGSTVYIHDMTGTLIHQITTDRSGNAIFRSSAHISLSIYENRVYVADKCQGLVTLDSQGNYESTFTDPGFVQPCGVCTDGRGNIFVNGMSSDLFQISEKFKTKLGVLRDMLVSHSTCFDPQRNILVVTQTSNDVQIKELE